MFHTSSRPKVLLIPPPELPVPAVQGGAVETLLPLPPPAHRAERLPRRPHPDKGLPKLREALGAVENPRIKLLIVGSPFFGRTQQSSFLRKLEQQARGLEGRVQFTGYIPNEALPADYHLADVVCVPTMLEEAAGMVEVASMACGRT